MWQLNDKIPELYQLALSKYQMEGDDLYNQYAMLGAQEEQEYGRYRDTVSDYNAELDRLQNQYNAERDYDYGMWADNRDFGYGQYIDDRNYQYQQDRDKVADQQWQAEFDEALRQFNFANKLGEFAVAASSSGGSGGTTYKPAPTPQPTEPTEIEVEMDNYVRTMLNKAYSSQFNPEQVIKGSGLSEEKKNVALEILDAYISSGAMKSGGKL